MTQRGHPAPRSRKPIVSALKNDSFCSGLRSEGAGEMTQKSHTHRALCDLRKALEYLNRERRGSKMDTFTVAPDLKGTKGDIIAARIEVPILVVMIYGIVEFIRLGFSQDHYLYTYAPVLGGVAASVGLFTYFFIVSVRRKRSWKILLVLLGFLPYLYSLYVMGFLGVYTIFEGVVGVFSAWSMIGGILWVFVGFH